MGWSDSVVPPSILGCVWILSSLLSERSASVDFLVVPAIVGGVGVPAIGGGRGG